MSGLIGSLKVLEAQRRRLAAELAQSRTLDARFVVVVPLHRGHGGGWAQDDGQAGLP